MAAGAVGIDASHSTEWRAEDRTDRRHLAGRRSASSRYPRRCRLRQSLIAVARDEEVTRSPGRFGCAVETSTAGDSGPKRTAREGLRCGTAATRLGFDQEWSSRKRD